MVSVLVKLKVRLHGAVAVSIEVIVAVAVAPPGTVTVVELPGRVMVEVTPPSVMVVVWTAPGPWTVVVLVLVTCSGRLDEIKQDRRMSGRKKRFILWFRRLGRLLWSLHLGL